MNVVFAEQRVERAQDAVLRRVGKQPHRIVDRKPWRLRLRDELRADEEYQAASRACRLIKASLRNRDEWAAFHAEWPGEPVKIKCIVDHVCIGMERIIRRGETAIVPDSLAHRMIERGQVAHG